MEDIFGKNLKQSSNEHIIENFMKQNKIKFVKQYKFSDCKNKRCLPFDFYLPDNNLCIEFDGRQHFESISYFGGIKGLIKRKINDDIKTNYCKNNNIKLLRISYKENITDKLYEYFSEFRLK
jgi:hypothetical protein